MTDSTPQSSGNVDGASAPATSDVGLAAEIARLKSRIDSLEDGLASASSASEARIAASIALLEDANGWAQHFSNVRLGVVTFLSGICLGIMNFKWHDPQAVFIWSTLTVWLLGMSLFVIFSMEQWRKLDQRRRNVQNLREESNDSRRQANAFQGVRRLTHEWLRQKDWAYAAYFALSAIFFAAWALWVTQPPAR